MFIDTQARFTASSFRSEMFTNQGLVVYITLLKEL
jgi:hypothetical protein